jgi:putative heme-binding domain-containing protein
MLVDALIRTPSPAAKLDMLRGIQAALEGRAHMRKPGGWQRFASSLDKLDDRELGIEAHFLGLIFGRGDSRTFVGQVAGDTTLPVALRTRAIEALITCRQSQSPVGLISMLGDSAVRIPALRGLAAYDDKRVPEAILQYYPRLTVEEKQVAIGTLVSRPQFARTLLEALERKKIPSSDVSIYNVRQLRELHVPEIDAKLEEVWGITRTTPAEKLALIKKYRGQLDPAALARADRPHGRAVFARVCAACHKLFGEGAEIGPDLTGSQRANLDYVLQNVVDPSAIVGRDYRMTLVTTDDGRVITGIVKKETESSLSIQTPTQLVVLAKADIQQRKQSMISMMPEALLENLKPDEVRDLIGYLASPSQVPLPPPIASPAKDKKP